jgi:hypothetical protein
VVVIDGPKAIAAPIFDEYLYIGWLEILDACILAFIYILYTTEGNTPA